MSDTTDMTPPHEESRKLTLAKIEVLLHRLTCSCSNIRLGHFQEPPPGHIAHIGDQLEDINEVLQLQPNYGIKKPDYKEEIDLPTISEDIVFTKSSLYKF